MTAVQRSPGLDDPVAEGTIDGMVAHPRFQDAVRHIGARYLAMHADWARHKTVSDEGRFLISQYAICLHAGYRPDVPDSGLTLARLIRQCEAFGIMSHGRVEATVSLLRKTGRLREAPPDGNRRSRRLVPGPGMEAEFRERVRYHLEALDLVRPGRDYLRRLEADPGFFWAFERHRGALVATVPSLRLRLPGLTALAHIEGGYLVTMALIHGIDGPIRPCEVAFPLAENAARYNVPRTQLRRVLESLEAVGMIENLEERTRRVRILPAAVETMLAWHAIRLLRHDRNGARAAAERDGFPYAAG